VRLADRWVDDAGNAGSRFGLVPVRVRLTWQERYFTLSIFAGIAIGFLVGFLVGGH
jgi:hypothetical protein